jgi:type II secretory pathway component PulJ
MRKGYCLIEMMVIIIVFPAVMLVLNGLFRTLVRDIPQASRVVQENTTVLDVLEQIQQDVDRAKGLPQSSAGYTADNQVLLVELEDGTICYELADGKVLRRNLADNAKGATS